MGPDEQRADSFSANAIVSAGLVDDALQVDHYARLVMSIHASWPGRNDGEIAQPGYHLLPIVRDDRHPVR